MYENCVIYGPYTSDDGRLRIYVSGDTINTTISYPKYIMECYINRYLLPNEIVHHIDGDVSNNDISNLIVLDRSEHAKLHANRLIEQEFVCPYCNTSFILVGTKLKNAIANSKRGKRGPFCCRSCAGKYGRSIQLGLISPIDETIITPTYINTIERL